ncbi:nucleotidyltransferase family protein [Actinokineospora globicatena]|uniref:nucleotidyltransferase family protein n=1 Tax=Actinokineospora globicatena TaxID=103729 RepID=UPI0020A575E9|nr:nucleotidyltransferase family protein [Actinokineospora globicatena]GLW86660.1 hypothetical protein Aglo02_42990 [Actinokineospora globicatena]
MHDDADSAGVAFESLVDGVDWDLLVAGALRQRLLPKLADFVIRSGGMSVLGKELRKILVQARHENRHKGRLAAREAARVVEALTAAGVNVVCTKGVVHQAALYDGSGGRVFGDVDLMIDQAGAAACAQVMPALGYLPGLRHDLVADTLVPLEKRDLAMYKLYPDHLPHFLRPLLGEALPYFMVDFCFDIVWYGAAWRIPMAEVLAETRLVTVDLGDGTVELPALTQPYDFLFTVTHLFREAWFERTAAVANPRLNQFADLWRQWSRLSPATVVELRELVHRHEIGPPVAWGCHYVDQLHGSDIVGALGLAEFCDEGWLRSASGTGGQYLSWSGDMRARVRALGPPEFLPAPEPRFGSGARAVSGRVHAGDR